jgi:hypothetical protein
MAINAKGLGGWHRSRPRLLIFISYYTQRVALCIDGSSAVAHIAGGVLLAKGGAA